jgi:hypothetical protein
MRGENIAKQLKTACERGRPGETPNFKRVGHGYDPCCVSSLRILAQAHRLVEPFGLKPSVTKSPHSSTTMRARHPQSRAAICSPSPCRSAQPCSCSSSSLGEAHDPARLAPEQALKDRPVRYFPLLAQPTPSAKVRFLALPARSMADSKGPLRVVSDPTFFESAASRSRGLRAYRGRLGKGRSPTKTRHSIASPK